MNSNSTTKEGTFSSIYNSNLGEISLADLATKGYVDQFLYYFATPNSNAASSTGVKVATIRTKLNTNNIITTEINPVSQVTTPIPAAAWLMGSGLLGMIGIRRKNKA
jgi:hypothetical protein